MCEVCFSTFSRKGDLKRHNHLHTGFKYDPYILAGKVATDSIPSGHTNALIAERGLHNLRP